VELLLGLFARGVPRGVVRPAAGEQLQPAGDVDDLAVDVHRRIPRPVEHLVDREVVVVAGDQVERDRGAVEALGRELQPRLQPL
jgi:hypothetical protein